MADRRPGEAQRVASGPGPERTGGWVSATLGREGFRTDVHARSHALVADEPRDAGGTDAGPTPYELLLGALASCTTMTLRMYADRRRWPLEDVVVRLRTQRSHAADCADCDTKDVDPGRLQREIDFTGPLDEVQRARLLLIADRCPVKQALERGLRVESPSR